MAVKQLPGSVVKTFVLDCRVHTYDNIFNERNNMCPVNAGTKPSDNVGHVG